MSTIVPVSALYTRLVAATAAQVAACRNCRTLPTGQHCLSHTCLDCGRLAHPHSQPCQR
jgi:hypothetical protein